MEIVTTETIPGEEIDETLGMIRGNAVMVKHVGIDILQGIKHLFGGELSDYSKLLTETREEAIKRMKETGRELDADAVVKVRLETSEIVQGGAEVIAYGTAVRFK